MPFFQHLYMTVLFAVPTGLAMAGFIKLNMIVNDALKARKARQAKAVPVSSAR